MLRGTHSADGSLRPTAVKGLPKVIQGGLKRVQTLFRAEALCPAPVPPYAELWHGVCTGTLSWEPLEPPTPAILHQSSPTSICHIWGI